MANLGYSRGADAPVRLKAGYGGNDEYGSANAPVLTGGVEADPTPTPRPQRGYASIGFEREQPQSAPIIPQEAKEDYRSEPAKKPVKAVKEPSFLEKAWSMVPSVSINQNPEDFKAKYTENLPTVEEINLGRKPGVKYDDEPEASAKIPVPFVPKAEAAPTYSASASSSEPSEAEIKAAKIAQANKDEADESALVGPEKAVEAAKKQPEAAGVPEALLAKKESVPSKSAEPERISRDKLMKMAGINDDANMRARGLQIESQNTQKKMGEQWNEASKMAASGNILERAQGLQKRAELEREGLARGIIKEPTGAEAAYKKFKNDPYSVDEFNRAAAEQQLQQQAEAQMAAKEEARRAEEVKAKKEEDKLAFEKEKFEFEKSQKQQDREDKFKEKLEDRKNKLADIKDEREYNKERDQLNSEQRMAEFASKFSKITERGDRDQRAMLTERMHNETQQQAAQAVKAALDEAKKYTGVFGRARAFVDGKDRDTEIKKVVDSYERQLNDQQKRFAEIGNIYGVKVPTVPFDRARIESAIQRRGPETSDDLIATFEDLAKAGEFGIKYLTPAGRAGTAFGMAANSMGGQQAPIPAPFLPQQSGINYGNLLNQ